MTSAQRLLRELIDLRIENRKVYLSHSQYAQNAIISGGFAPAWYFQRPDCGGSDAGREIRFLRNPSYCKIPGHEVPIFKKTHKYIGGDGNPHFIPIYRLNMTPDEVRSYDWSPAFKTPFNWIFDHHQLNSIRGMVAFDPNRVMQGSIF